MDDATVKKNPVELVKLAIITKGYTFDKAFREVDDLCFKQTGRRIPRKEFAKRVLQELEKEVK